MASSLNVLILAVALVVLSPMGAPFFSPSVATAFTADGRWPAGDPVSRLAPVEGWDVLPENIPDDVDTSVFSELV